MKLNPDKKSVLVFIDWFLPGDKAGGPVRSCINLIDQLGDEFRFSVVTRDTDYTSSIPYSEIKSDVWNDFEGKRIFYISQANLNKETIARLILEEKPDVVYLNGIWSQPFTAWPLKTLKNLKKKIKVVVAARGMLAPSALEIKATKKKLYLRIAKWRDSFSEVIFHATNEKEAIDIRKALGDKVKCLVAGNLPRKLKSDTIHSEKTEGKLRIVNIARVAPEKNTLYALEVLRKVKSEVVADFFGTIYDEVYAEKCRELVKAMPENVKVNFHEAVSSSAIADLLAKYDLMFMPTRGENFGHIILEALQSGTPVLISDQTPWKNLKEKNAGWDLPLNSISTFVERIESLSLLNEKDFVKFRVAAKVLAENYAADKKVMEENRNLFL